MSSQRKFTFAISSPGEFLVKSFIQRRLMVNSKDWWSTLPNWKHSRPYNKIGIHLALTSSKMTSLEAKFSSFPNCNKKLIRRWDSERELYLRRHCTRSKNTIDSCINSATDRFLQHRFTKFSEITQCNGHYTVQGHSRSPILVPIERSYTISY